MTNYKKLLSIIETKEVNAYTKQFHLCAGDVNLNMADTYLLGF